MTGDDDAAHSEPSVAETGALGRAVVPSCWSRPRQRIVVDLGCGAGHVARRVRGRDGSRITSASTATGSRRQTPRHPAANVHAARLDRAFRLKLQFDLAVARSREHLPEHAGGRRRRVATRLALRCVPGRGAEPGRHDHVNEQWPNHWVERFATRGYERWTHPYPDVGPPKGPVLVPTERASFRAHRRRSRRTGGLADRASASGRRHARRSSTLSCSPASPPTAPDVARSPYDGARSCRCANSRTPSPRRARNARPATARGGAENENGPPEAARSEATFVVATRTVRTNACVSAAGTGP